MTVPEDYRNASDDFEAFLLDLRDISGLQTTHQCYTMLQGVFQVFRRRLDVADAARFASKLPLLLGALFISDWDIAEPLRPFVQIDAMNREVKTLRHNHNVSVDDAIQCVSQALRRDMGDLGLSEALRDLPPEASNFWGL